MTRRRKCGCSKRQELKDDFDARRACQILLRKYEHLAEVLSRYMSEAGLEAKKTHSQCVGPRG